MRIKVLACKVFTREIALIVAQSRHTIDVTYLRQGLHNTPEILRRELQAEIDRIDARDDVHTQEMEDGSDYEAIVLAYGLCSNAICGLTSKRYRLIVPRAHDCIAMILGSRHKYREYFDTHPGTYWYSQGWIEQTEMPGQDRVDRTKARYTEKYGEDNAEYLMEMEQEWLRKYDRCTYISWPSLSSPDDRKLTQEAADFLGWKYDELESNEGLMRRLLEGQWDPQEVLVVQPGDTFAQSYDDDVVVSQPSSQ